MIIDAIFVALVLLVLFVSFAKDRKKTKKALRGKSFEKNYEGLIDEQSDSYTNSPVKNEAS